MDKIKMQTLRKKTSPLKYKNETSRFLGEGVSFKAKLIGILEVSEARGDRMCQEALADLKMAIRAAGEHKQRITINIAIDGLRLRDEKTGDSLYHHPVHKISFIAQDMSDSRAFGYIFGSPDTGHRFFGIKTDKAASQVVIAMRDLFQVVFALKKKEIELAKQHLDKSRYSTSPLFSDRSITSKSNLQDTSTKSSSDSKGATASSSEQRSTPAVADLVDLELELNSLQQGLTQMERITPSDPFGRNEDPFGDSFTSFSKAILPPPPSSGRDRSTRVSESSSIFSPKTPHTVGGASCDSSSAADLFNTSRDTPKDFSFNEFNSSHDEPSSGDWFTPPAGNSLFEDAPSSLPPTSSSTTLDKDKQHELVKQDILAQFDVFTELDPLGTKNYQNNNQTIGTGKSKPYVDKKHFFQELKNPPKKVLNELASESAITTQATPLESHSQHSLSANFASSTLDQSLTPSATATGAITTTSNNSIYNNDPFGEDPFDQTDPFADADFKVFERDLSDYKLFNNNGNTNNTSNNTSNSNLNMNNLSNLERDKSSKGGISGDLSQLFKADFEFSSSSSSAMKKMFEHQSFDVSSEGEAPDPPPRPTSTLIKPPPLPPKKQMTTTDMSIKAPPRPKHESHYDYIDKYESGKSLLLTPKNDDNPPLPAPARKTKQTSRFESDFISNEDEYLTPIGLLPPPKSTRKSRSESPNVSANTNNIMNNETTPSVVSSSLMETPTTTPQLNDLTMDTLDITLSQLTLSGLNEFASKLNIPASQLSNMTLVQLTSYLSNFVKNKNSATDTSRGQPVTNFDTFNETMNQLHEEKTTESSNTTADFADFNAFNTKSAPTTDILSVPSYDRYAAFRELVQEEEEEIIIKTNTIEDEHNLFDNASRSESLTLNDDNDNNVEGSISMQSLVKTPNNDLTTSSILKTEELFSGNVFQEERNITEVTTAETFTTLQTTITTSSLSTTVDRYAALREISLMTETEVRSTEDIDTIEEDEEEEDEDEADVEADVDNNDDGSGELEEDIHHHPLQTIDEVTSESNQNNRNMNDDQVNSSSVENDLNLPITDMQIIDDVKNENNSTTFKNFEVQNQLLQHRQQQSVGVNFKEQNLITQSGSLSDVISGSSPDVDADENNEADNKKEGESWAIFNQPNLIAEETQKEIKAIQSEEGVSPWSSDSKEFGNGSPTDWRIRRDSGRWSGGRGGSIRSSGRSQEGWWDTSAEPETPYYNRRSTDSFEEDCYDCYDRPRRTRRQGSREQGSTWCGQPSGGGHSSSSRDVSPWEEEPRRPRDGRHWASRHSRQSFERHGERYATINPHPDSWDEDDDYEYEDERFHWHSERHPRDLAEWEERRIRSSRNRRDMDRERWCCPDYDSKDIPTEPLNRYGSGRWCNPDRRKHDERYYQRDSQESPPWEDEYANEMAHYLTTRRPRMRPSSATEMDRKSGDSKTRGSDNERDRRYKSNRRSKSRDSQYSEPPRLSRQLEPPMRGPLRKQHPKFEDYDSTPSLLKEPPTNTKKSNTTCGRKSRTKENPKTEDTNTFPRKSRTVESSARSTPQPRSMFENDFVQYDDYPAPTPITTVSENKWYKKPTGPPPMKYRQKSLFEDDFSPTADKEKSLDVHAPPLIVKQESHNVEEAAESLGPNNLDIRANNGKKRLNRISQLENNLKKSESVNIFARESDPFDDDFFAETANGDSKWAHRFDDNRT